MTVDQLIELLRQHPPSAVVVIGDDEDGGIGKLRAENVRSVRLRFGEAKWIAWYELAQDDEPADVLGVRISGLATQFSWPTRFRTIEEAGCDALGKT